MDKITSITLQRRNGMYFGAYSADVPARAKWIGAEAWAEGLHLWCIADSDAPSLPAIVTIARPRDGELAPDGELAATVSFAPESGLPLLGVWVAVDALAAKQKAAA